MGPWFHSPSPDEAGRNKNRSQIHTHPHPILVILHLSPNIQFKLHPTLILARDSHSPADLSRLPARHLALPIQTHFLMRHCPRCDVPPRSGRRRPFDPLIEWSKRGPDDGKIRAKETSRDRRRAGQFQGAPHMAKRGTRHAHPSVERAHGS